jgi:hypothetical protein
MTVPAEPHGQPNHAPGWLEVLGATIAGTMSVGVNLAGPAWVATVLGIAVPLVVGFTFPTAGTLPLVAGLLLAPLVAAVARGERLWLVVLTLPFAAGLTFILVRIGQRLRAPAAAVDPEVRGKQLRLAIMVAIAAAVIVPGGIANARMSRDADARAQATGEKLRQVLNDVEPGVSPSRFRQLLSEQVGPVLARTLIGPRELRVTAEVTAGWQRRCVRGVREVGTSANIEISPTGCG